MFIVPPSLGCQPPRRTGCWSLWPPGCQSSLKQITPCFGNKTDVKSFYCLHLALSGSLEQLPSLTCTVSRAEVRRLQLPEMQSPAKHCCPLPVSPGMHSCEANDKITNKDDINVHAVCPRPGLQLHRPVLVLHFAPRPQTGMCSQWNGFPSHRALVAIQRKYF